jgi:hypothetical protein
MIEFATAPDPVFLAILREALDYVREELYPYPEETESTTEELAELDERYRNMYPELTRFFSRTDALAIVSELRSALDAASLYRVTDFHWLVLYICLQMFSDLHNDGALATDGHVGPYIVDRIELSAIEERFFFDTDFAFGPEFLIAREHNRYSVPDVSPQVFKIAAGAKPDPADLELTAIAPSEASTEPADETRSIPKSGYVGPYPMREPTEDK